MIYYTSKSKPLQFASSRPRGTVPVIPFIDRYSGSGKNRRPCRLQVQGLLPPILAVAGAPLPTCLPTEFKDGAIENKFEDGVPTHFNIVLDGVKARRL